MVDLTRDCKGRLHAHLIEVVPGRSGTVYAEWLREQTEQFIARIEHAALDPFRGYVNAIRDALSDAVAVPDTFHVVKLGHRRRRLGPTPSATVRARPPWSP